MSGAGADFAKLDFLQLVNKAFYVNEEKMLSRESEPEPKGVGADRKKTGSATLLNAIKLEIKYCIFYFISGQNNCFRKCLLYRILFQGCYVGRTFIKTKGKKVKNKNIHEPRRDTSFIVFMFFYRLHN